jgi:hypothetical protein
MDEKLLTKQFEELKHQLPVNEDLRRELREVFRNKKYPPAETGVAAGGLRRCSRCRCRLFGVACLYAYAG